MYNNIKMNTDDAKAYEYKTNTMEDSPIDVIDSNEYKGELPDEINILSGQSDIQSDMHADKSIDEMYASIDNNTNETFLNPDVLDLEIYDMLLCSWFTVNSIHILLN